MAGNIKGITIEFAGNTTKLDRAIKKAEANSKSLDRELRNINKALKFNPKSVELWSQKQKVLTERVDETKNQLEALREKQKKMDAAGVDKTTAEYRKLEREIVETESKLKHFQDELKKTNNYKIDQLGRQFDAVGKKISNVGDNLTKKVTVPLLALGAGSFAAFKDVDKGMDAVVKKTGATGDELAAMQQSVKDLGTEIPASFEDIGNAVGEVNTRFGLTGQELEETSAKFLKFAKLNDTDVTTSIDNVQKALAAYGLDASHAGEYLDALNATAQATGVDVDKLAAGIVTNGAAFQEMGLDINQVTYFMGQLEKSGANSSTVLNGMRKALKNSAKEGKDLNQSLDELEDAIRNGKDGMDGLNMAYELFGRSGDQIYAAVKNGSLSFKDLGTAALNASGNIDTTFGNTLDASDQLKLTFNALKEAGAAIGAALGKVLVPMLKKAAAAFQRFAKWFDKLSPKTKDLIAKLGLLAAAAGPVLSVAGRITSKVGSLISSAPKLIAGVTKLTAAIATNPFIAIAIGAAAAVAGITALVLAQTKIVREYEKAKKAREEEIKGAYTQAASAEVYAQKLDELSQKENKSASDKQLMRTYVDQLNQSVEGLNLQYDAENDKLSQSTEQIYSKIEAYKQQVIQQAYANQMQEVANELVQTEMELDDTRTQKAEYNAQLRQAIMDGDIDKQRWLQTEIDILGQKEDQLQQKQAGLYNELDTYADRAAGNVEKVGDSMDNVASTAGTKGEAVGSNFGGGVAAGIEAANSLVRDVATRLINNAVAAMKAAASIASPSKVTKNLIGRNLGLGVGVGLMDSLGAVEKDANRFIDGTVNAMLATPPQVNVAGISGTGAGRGVGTTNNTRNVNQTINIYQPVSTPAETARAIRQQEIVQGLAG